MKTRVFTFHVFPIMVLLAIVVTFPLSGFCQDKFEKESRISEKEVPSKARSFIYKIVLDQEVKWYMEHSQSGNSIEAKFKLNQKAHSIEFDSLGNVEDVEIKIDWHQIPEEVRKNISRGMDLKFIKWTIRKIQIQYTGDDEALITLTKKGETDYGYTVKYEIVVKGKESGRPQLFEMTFSDKGALLKSLIIIFKNTDILEY
ncbi:MAG: hypothetical protein AAFN93_12315 [Bacteroidota bacterium]